METVTTKSFGRRLAEGRKPNGHRAVDAPEVQSRKGKSRITNGSVFIPGMDQRSAWIRRCKDLINLYVSEGGGEANTSTSEHAVIRRIAVLMTEAERLELKFASDGEASAKSLDLYQRVANTLRRQISMLVSLRAQRRPKDVLTLDQYIASLPKEEVVTGEASEEVSDDDD